MKFKTLFGFATALSLLILQTISSCAVNRVIYNEQMEFDGILAKVVVLDGSDLKELVISMQEPGHPIRERVFRINWIPDIVEIGDYNSDSRMDVKIISTNDETHYFYGTEHAFIDI
jgi:hypothetical protein